MSAQNALIILNGSLTVEHFVKYVDPSTYFKLAVDGGLRYFHQMLIPPDVLIGDLDSVTDQDLAWAKQHATQIFQFSVDKDESDFQLALNWVAERHFKHVLVAGGLGGRLDQTLANCFLLLDDRLKEMTVQFDDGYQEVSLIRDHCMIKGHPGDTISLLPLQHMVRGVRTHRLKYPLNEEDLFMHQARGISNVMLDTTAEVEIKDGFLLCIHTRQGG